MWKKKMAGILAVVALCGSMAVSAADYRIYLSFIYINTQK